MVSQDLNDLISKLKKLPGPIVLIWLPYGKNTFGHAALLTDEYYISFWPSKGKRIAEISKTSAVGRLHFHVKEDFEAEGNRVPTLHEIVNVTNQQINDEYVQFLVYNGINPTEVSLAAAENLTGQWRMDLARTSYSFVGNVIVEKGKKRKFSDLLFCFERCLTPGWGNNTFCLDCKKQSVPVECLFYHKPQSCVSFCFNLIEMADPKPLVCLIEARKNHSLWPVLDSLLGMCLEISVPNFEEHIVKKYWLKGCKRERYNVLVFQKRTLSVMLMENLFKKILTSLPTIFVLQLLQVSFDFSYPLLCSTTWIFHSMYFILLYVVLVRLFPTIHVPKPIAVVIGGVMILIILIGYLIFQFYYSQSLNLIVNFIYFFIFVVISEFVMRMCLVKFNSWFTRCDNVQDII